MKPSSAAGAKGKGVKDHQLPEWPEIRPLVQLGERTAAKDVWRAMTVRAIKPTAKMAANAKLGLELRRKFGRGGTEVGVRRAEGLIAGEDLSPRDVRAIYSYFARHEVDKFQIQPLAGLYRLAAMGRGRWQAMGGAAAEQAVRLGLSPSAGRSGPRSGRFASVPPQHICQPPRRSRWRGRRSA